jgi:uncharacterized protein (UPF0335 family)
MAEQLNTETAAGGMPRGNNTVADRAATIRDTCQRVEKLDEEIKALQADRRGLIKDKIKGDLGMKIADFNIAYRMYQLEQEDRDTMVDTMRECFSALGLGDQLNWLDAAEKAEPQPAAAE